MFLEGVRIRRIVHRFALLFAVLLNILFLGCNKKAAVSNSAISEPVPSSSEGNQRNSNTRHWTSEVDARDAIVFSKDADDAFLDAFQPDAEGWHTEAFSQAVEKQLKVLSKVFTSNLTQKDLAQRLHGITHRGYAGADLIPSQLDMYYTDGQFDVRVASKFHETSKRKGVSGLADSIDEIVQRLTVGPDAYVKFKIVGVEWNPPNPSTKLLFQASCRGLEKAIQHDATWNVTWNNRTASPRITRIEIVDFKEVVSKTGVPQFSDDIERILSPNSSFHQQLRHGIDYWRDRIPQHMGIYYFGHHGLTIGDADGDGYEDVYVCQPGGLPNRLFLHQLDGTAVDVSRDAGVDVLNNTRSALLLDLDNDGDNDLVVCATDQLLIFANGGDAKFTLATTIPYARGGYSVSAIDYDNDTLLDLYVCVYLNQVANEGRLPYPVPYHDANNGGQNILLRNVGNLQFEDTTHQVGLDQHNSRFSYAGVWEDFDSDGDMDLYVANDFGHNCLYRNDSGTFVDVASEIGLEDTGFGMSATWGDFDQDGFMDLYVGNMYSGAGNRIAFQEQFQPGGSTDIRRKLQRSARGNSLFRNNGDGTFQDVTLSSETAMGRWSWGTLFVDTNNNGFQDLVAVNGMVTGTSAADL